MRGVTIELKHRAGCPLNGLPQAEAVAPRRCKCAPAIRARISGVWTPSKVLPKGWLTADYEAFEAEAIAIRAAEDPEAIVTRRKVPTLAEWGEQWLRRYEELCADGIRSPETLRSYKAIWKNHVKPILAKDQRRITSITADTINDFKTAKLQDGCSPGYVTAMITLLSGMLTDAVEAGHLKSNPASRPRHDRSGASRRRVRLPKSQEAPERLVDLDFARALLADSRGTVIGDMILCGLTTGFRLREILGLKPQDILWTERRINLERQLVRATVERPPKYNSYRKAVLYSRFGQSVGQNHDRYLFINPQTRLAFHEDAAQRAFGAAWAKLGERPRGHSWHVLRHTFASLLKRHRIRPEVVDELMGHSRPGISERYSHVWPEELDDIEAILEATYGSVLAPIEDPTASSV